jgi:two-component system KDP operon response regulator KdpE
LIASEFKFSLSQDIGCQSEVQGIAIGGGLGFVSGGMNSWLGGGSFMDDYLTKPFGMSELLARLRVALRHRATLNADSEPIFETGNLKVDLVRREVSRAGKPIHLTPNEYGLLSILVKYAGRILTHRQLLKEIWGPGASQATPYLRVYMNQLRQKLESDPAQPESLITEPGIGYRLVETAG